MIVGLLSGFDVLVISVAPVVLVVLVVSVISVAPVLGANSTLL